MIGKTAHECHRARIGSVPILGALVHHVLATLRAASGLGRAGPILNCAGPEPRLVSRLVFHELAEAYGRCPRRLALGLRLGPSMPYPADSPRYFPRSSSP